MLVAPQAWGESVKCNFQDHVDAYPKICRPTYDYGGKLTAVDGWYSFALLDSAYGGKVIMTGGNVGYLYGGRIASFLGAGTPTGYAAFSNSVNVSGGTVRQTVIGAYHPQGVAGFESIDYPLPEGYVLGWPLSNYISISGDAAVGGMLQRRMPTVPSTTMPRCPAGRCGMPCTGEL